MARTDKAMRILSTQLELLRGGKVYKKSYCKKNEVSARTFDRDIVEIRMSLSESFSGQEVKYVRNENYYYLDKPDMIKPLTAIEASFLLEMIKTCQVLQREEYVGMVLSYLRMEDMGNDLKFQWYPIGDIMRQAVRKYSQIFILKKIHLNFQDSRQMVLTDEKWLLFVIEQILSNALKYTSSDEVRPPKAESISLYIKGTELVVEDTGIGIASEDLPRIFERGFTGYNGREHQKSTGIGLYLCKTIIQKLGHSIRAESRVGVGTKIYISLERENVKFE